MSRPLLGMAVSLVLMALLRSAAVLFGVAAIPATPATVVVAWGALALAPLEGIVTAALCGLVVDALAGLPLGVSSFTLVVALLVGRLGLRFFPRSSGVLAASFAGGLGALQALLSWSLLAFFTTSSAPLSLWGILLVGIIDLGLALALFPVLHRLGGLVGLEKATSTAERLAARL